MNDNVILLGNSLNLLEDQGQHWEKLVEECESGLDSTGEDPEMSEMQKKQIPLVFRMSRFFNRWQAGIADDGADCENTKYNAEDGSRAFSKLCRKISELRPNAMHVRLMKLIEDCNIITTNYDYAIESALGKNHAEFKESNIELSDLLYRREFAVLNNLTRHSGRVWHIHGEAGEPGSVVIDHDGYARGLAALKFHGRHEATWLHLFLNSTVHILGLELRYTESLLWYALQARLENISSEKKVYYYHFVREDVENEKNSANNLESLLDAFKVEYRRIDVHKKGMSGEYDYWDAWERALKKLENSMHPLLNNDFPPFRTSYPLYNIVTSSTPTSANSERCWMNIGVEKLKSYEDGDYWIFDCNVRGERRVHGALVKDVRESLERNNASIIKNGTPRYSFYIDYANGILYKSISSDEPLLQLSKITDSVDYEEYKKRTPKQDRYK